MHSQVASALRTNILPRKMTGVTLPRKFLYRLGRRLPPCPPRLTQSSDFGTRDAGPPEVPGTALSVFPAVAIQLRGKVAALPQVLSHGKGYPMPPSLILGRGGRAAPPCTHGECAALDVCRAERYDLLAAISGWMAGCPVMLDLPRHTICLLCVARTPLCLARSVARFTALLRSVRNAPAH